jgi:adenosylmethionine-8-amino-7-oxononanoate aminotransferase
VRALCDKYGILFIADEVMCGMGRTGTMFAIEQDGVAPDLITVAKGLGAGYQPIGAVLANGAIVERLRQRQRQFLHGHTYIGHPVAAAAALAVQQVIERDDLLVQVQKRGATLRRMLGDVFGPARTWATSAGAGCSWRSNWCATARPRSRSRRSCKLHAAIKQRRWRAG